MNGVCQPVRSPGYGNPVSGTVSGEAAGAASGYAAGGPVGAVVGGALGTATRAVTGTANALAPPPVCNRGYTYYNRGSQPAPQPARGRAEPVSGPRLHPDNSPASARRG